MRARFSIVVYEIQSDKMVETVVTVERNTTTTQSSAARGSGFSTVQLNLGYFIRLPGIIKLIQFVSTYILIYLESIEKVINQC